MKQLLLSYALSFSLIASGQSFPFNDIEYIGAERGLSGNEVYCITQDRNGFIWVVTDMALNRYDGYSFRSWTYDPKDNNSISTGFYSGLTEDINGVLWIPSEVRGLYSFDPYREKFTHYLHQPGNDNSLLDDKVYAVEADPDGTIWISTAKGLDNFDPRKKTFTHIIDAGKDPAEARIRYALHMDNGKESLQNKQVLWMLNTTPGIDRFDTYSKKGTKNYLFPFPSKPGQCMANSTVVITPNNKNRIWIGSDHNGIYGFDIRTEQYLHIPSEKTCSAKMHNNGYYKVWEDSKGNLWTTNDDHEIIYYDQAEKKFYYYPVQKKGVQFLNLIPVIWEDNRNKIWICTNSGLITIDTRQKKFVKLSHDKNDHASISGNYVFSINRISSSQLLVNSDSVEVFDKKTNSFSTFPLMIDGKKINARGFWDIYKDRSDMLWFTGWAGVVSHDIKTATTRAYELHTAAGRRAFPGCIGVAEDNRGRYWLPSWGYGLYLFDPATALVNPYQVGPGPNSLSTNYLSKIWKDSKGFLYVNGWDGGFIRFDPEKEQFKIYKHDPADQYSVGSNHCHSIIETDDGLIWFGTMGGGVNVFNPATQKFKSFTTADGLAHDNVTTLLKDKAGRFWVGTRGGGISCFMPPKKPFDPGATISCRNYDISDGLPSNVINLGTGFCDTDGTLYFGTRDAGMFYFHPDDLVDNTFVPPVFITELKILNKTITLYQQDSILKMPVEFTKSIRLAYNKNMLSFSFASLNYAHSEKNKYAYMLEGYDEDWVYTDASRRFITYTNLAPRKYTFKVKGSNNDGVWNEVPAELSIVIVPPFWQTWWFKLFVLAVIGMIFLWIL